MAATQLRASKTASWYSKDRQLRVSGGLWSSSSILEAAFAKTANYLAIWFTDPLKDRHANIAGGLWMDHVAAFGWLPCVAIGILTEPSPPVPPVQAASA